MKIYRIYTENTKRQPQVRKILDTKLPGYTLIRGVGYWEGKQEQSLVIEHIGEPALAKTILDIAKQIRIENRQRSVLVTTQDIDMEFVNE